MFRTADKYVRLHSVLLQQLDRMLGRLGLELFGRTQIRHESQVYHQTVLIRQFPLKLTHGLDERQGLDISDSTAYLGDDHIILSALTQQQHPAFDLIGYMWDYLNGLAQIGTLSLLIYDSTVNLACSDIVRTGCIDVEKSLVVTKIQVCLRPILRHEALSVLIRVKCTRIHVEIWIEFLNGDPKVPGL